MAGGSLVIAVFLVFAAPFVGSFLALFVERRPAGRPVLFARSACDACGRRLTVAELAPLISWLALRGRCRTCGAAIGVFAPAMELAALAIALWSLVVAPGWFAVVSAGLGWTLLALSAVDWRHMYLPDVLTIPLMAAGLVVTALLSEGRLLDHVIGLLIGGALPLLVAEAYRRARGVEGLGLGDVKLFAAGGAWLGWQALPSLVFVAAFAGLLWALASGLARSGEIDAQRALPFGPFIAAAIWMIWLYGPLELAIFG